MVKSVENMLNHTSCTTLELKESVEFLNENSDQHVLISTLLSFAVASELLKPGQQRVATDSSDNTIKEQLSSALTTLNLHLESSKPSLGHVGNMNSDEFDAFKLQADQMSSALIQSKSALARTSGEIMKSELAPLATNILQKTEERVALILPIVETKVIGFAKYVSRHSTTVTNADDRDTTFDTVKPWLMEAKAWVLQWSKLFEAISDVSKDASLFEVKDGSDATANANRVTAQRFVKRARVWSLTWEAVDWYFQNLLVWKVWSTPTSVDALYQAIGKLGQGIKYSAAASKAMLEESHEDIKDVMDSFNATVAKFFSESAES